MKKKQRVPVVYLVHWPELNVMKAGISTQKRWRAFLQRGAEVVDLVEFEDYADASAFESVVLKGISLRGQRAFGSAVEAIPYLGGNGGGYCECYLLTEGLAPMELLRSTDWLSV